MSLHSWWLIHSVVSVLQRSAKALLSLSPATRLMCKNFFLFRSFKFQYYLLGNWLKPLRRLLRNVYERCFQPRVQKNSSCWKLCRQRMFTSLIFTRFDFLYTCSSTGVATMARASTPDVEFGSWDFFFNLWLFRLINHVCRLNNDARPKCVLFLFLFSNFLTRV